MGKKQLASILLLPSRTYNLNSIPCLSCLCHWFVLLEVHCPKPFSPYLGQFSKVQISYSDCCSENFPRAPLPKHRKLLLQLEDFTGSLHHLSMSLSLNFSSVLQIAFILNCTEHTDTPPTDHSFPSLYLFFVFPC